MIYTASKVKHAAKWRALRDEGVPIVATWIDEAGGDETQDYADLWIRCVKEASTAKGVLLYAEDGERLKGALVEAGAALACGVPVYAVLKGYDAAADAELVAQLGSWVRHPLVSRRSSIMDALLGMQADRVLS